MALLLSQQHLAVPDALQYVFRNHAHLLALEGIVQEEDIGAFVLEAVDLRNPRGCDHFVVLYKFGHIALAIEQVA